MIKHLYDKGQGTGKKEEVGDVLYNRGLTFAMMSVEAVKRAQIKYGKKPLKGEEVRWGLENLAIDQARDQEARLRGLHDADQHLLRRPRAAAATPAMHVWDGKKWNVQPGVYEADQQIIKPMIRASAEKYAAGEEDRQARLREGSGLISEGYARKCARRRTVVTGVVLVRGAACRAPR